MEKEFGKKTVKDVLKLVEFQPFIHWIDYHWNGYLSTPLDISFEDAVNRIFPGSRLRTDKIVSSIEGAYNKQREGNRYTELDPTRKVGFFDYSIKNPKGTLFILPGGGYWNICSYEEGFILADIANELGYSAFIVGYGVRDHARMPGPIIDLGNCIKDVYSKYEETITEDYEIVGASASGHLCAMFAAKEHGYLAQGLRKPKKVILMYPVIDFGKEAHVGSKANSLKEMADDENTQNEYSPQLHVDDDYPPTFICRGEADEIVPLINSEMMAEALAKAGVKYKKVTVPGQRHGFGPLWDEKGHSWFEEAIAWNE